MTLLLNNTFKEIQVKEITSNKTIHELKSGLTYYNYQGTHFRVFKTFADAMSYIESNNENLVIADFEEDDDLDDFIESYTFEEKLTILGHDIVIYGKQNFEVWDSSIDRINQDILNGNDYGIITQDNWDYDWNIVVENSYLDEKIEYLSEYNKVVYEHEQLIYEIFVNSEGDYEYNCYDFISFASGDTLQVVDGGCCTGSAKDAVYMAIR